MMFRELTYFRMKLFKDANKSSSSRILNTPRFPHGNIPCESARCSYSRSLFVPSADAAKWGDIGSVLPILGTFSGFLACLPDPANTIDEVISRGMQKNTHARISMNRQLEVLTAAGLS